mgnify:CR=1 FL=1
MEGSKSITLTPAVLLSLVLTIIPAAGGVIYKMSANDSKLQAIEDKVKKYKKTDVSKLLERISALEAMVNAQDKEIKRVDDSIQDVETNLSIWSEKEFSKVYEILNDNPLGR